LIANSPTILGAQGRLATLIYTLKECASRMDFTADADFADAAWATNRSFAAGL